ncbi:nucleotide-diphospho-sugar transferase [Hyaloraphidium curvatum]|nr:nucleotide-diphospho-sugar transferase [Hyaloraphidium curvatum]
MPLSAEVQRALNVKVLLPLAIVAFLVSALDHSNPGEVASFCEKADVAEEKRRETNDNPFIQDFYKFYSRSVEANVWGSALQNSADFPTSGLGAFMILWSHHDDDRAHLLKRCLQSLDVSFNDQFHYPVILLHEDLPQQTIDTIRSWTRSRIEFVGRALIDEEYLAVFNRTGYKLFNWYPEYLHMIRTNIYRWPLHRAFFGYRYIFKLDADAALVERIDFDVFEHLKRRNIMAAYVVEVIDQPHVVVNLYETAEDLLRYNQLKPLQDVNRKPKYWTWYGFAFIFDTAFARSPAYLNTVWHFDNVHGAFKHRWGDPHLYLLTSFFLNANQTTQLLLPIQHQANCENVKNESSCSQNFSMPWTQTFKAYKVPTSPKSLDWTWNPLMVADNHQ